jgi:hypothetical protein
MDPVTITLIITNVISYLLHGIHYQNSKQNSSKNEKNSKNTDKLLKQIEDLTKNQDKKN